MLVVTVRDIILEMSEGLHDSLGNLMNVYLNNQSDSEIKKNQKIEKKHTRLYISQQYIIRNIVILLTMISVLATLNVFAVSMQQTTKKADINNCIFKYCNDFNVFFWIFAKHE